MKVFFGVDIGGTEIKTGMFSEDCELIKKWSVRTNLSNGGRQIIPDVAQGIKLCMEYCHLTPEAIRGIGIGIPGPVNAAGYVEKCVNLNWNNFNPVTELKCFFPGSFINVGNDANVAALGEYYKGAGAGSFSMMMVTLGTGVGGGVIIDGKMIFGAHGLAGEIGHIAVNPNEKERCNCGNRGCIDQSASATGLVRIAKKLLARGSEASVLRSAERLSSKIICDSAKMGDNLAIQAVEESMRPLGIGLAQFSHAFDPEVYVIGGGVSLAGELIIEAVKKEYERNLYLIQKGAEIRLAKLGNDAGITGACMLARHW